MPWFPEKPGRYSVRMKYEVRAGTYPGEQLSIPSADPPVLREWPGGVFVGRVESAAVEIACE